MKHLLYIIVAFCASFGAAASEGTAGWQAYLDGDFTRARAEALAAARSTPSADAFALSCQAGLVIGGFFEGNRDAVRSLHQALDNCEQALAIDPDHFVAGLSHAIAIGFEGLRLRKASYARASKREIEALIAKYPRNAIAHGALAGWHAAVAREGWLARLFLGASRARAKSLYAEAFSLPGVEVPLVYEYARFLADGDGEDQQEARHLIAQALDKPAQNSLDALLLGKLQTLQGALAGGEKKQLKTSIQATIPFNNIDNWGSPDATKLTAHPLPDRSGAG